MSDKTSPSDKPVFFILGGPGSGKGTNCIRLSEEFGLVHISAGDLLREEAAKGTELGQTITAILKAGTIVPSEVTMRLLSNAMGKTPNACGFLIDGFPRKLDQSMMFERDICRARRVVYFDCSEAVMEARLMGRQNSGRVDDTLEIIRKRFRTNIEQCQPVVEKYRTEGRVDVVDCNVGGMDEIYAKVRPIFLKWVKKRAADDNEDGKQHVVLNDGRVMPVFGIGTYRARKNKCSLAVTAALRAGYRMIDTARGYNNEDHVAKGIADSGVPRGEIFIITKVPRDVMSYEGAMSACVASLKDLHRPSPPPLA